MAIAAALSSYRTVASGWVMLRSLRRERRYSVNFPASAAAINSASVELWDIVGWNRDRYTTGAPAKQRHIPDIERRCKVSPAQSESTYPMGVVGFDDGIRTSWLSFSRVGTG